MYICSLQITVSTHMKDWLALNEVNQTVEPYKLINAVTKRKSIVSRGNETDLNWFCGSVVY